MDAGPTDRVTDGRESVEAADSRPVILFDGVCNLCNASVKWVLERDPKARFRFASLQSDAAVSALAEAGLTDLASLPDSIVLVDGAGLHVRSTAAIRIARGLGFPYSVLGVAALVPRPVRDVVYRFVARNRYRWFGRRDVCMMPTPDTATRFLDAEEPRLPISAEARPANEGAPGSGPGTWLARLATVYILLYIAPLGFVLDPVVEWLGRTGFGVDATPQMTGSGDRTHNYVTLLVELALAILIATGWSVRSRRRALPPRFMDLSRVVARFYLGYFMLVYGWVKLFPLQFPLPGPDRLLQPYGDSSPMGLAWTFLGASVGYQMFSGIMELIGGYLLFWRRTSFVGALVTAAVMTNVMAINYFFDVPVKLFSTHLFLVALFIMAPGLPRLVGMAGLGLPTVPGPDVRFWRPRGRWRWAALAAPLLLVGWLTYGHVTTGLAQSRARGVLSVPSPLAGMYRVQSFERDGVVDREADDDVRWVRLGLNPPFAATIQYASGEAVRMRLSLDEEGRSLSFFDRGAQAPEAPDFEYVLDPGGTLTLNGTFAEAPMTVVMTRDDAGALLTSRGFSWINEFPFNR